MQSLGKNEPNHVILKTKPNQETKCFHPLLSTVLLTWVLFTMSCAEHQGAWTVLHFLYSCLIAFREPAALPSWLEKYTASQLPVGGTPQNLPLEWMKF